jgi:hypothetical protein
MTKHLLGSAALAVALSLASGAWADDNILSNGNTTTTNTNIDITDGGEAYVNSFNTKITAVAKQELSAVVTDNYVRTDDGDIKFGNASVRVGGSGGSVSGVSQSAANSGVASVVQQGLLLATSAQVKQ